MINFGNDRLIMKYLCQFYKEFNNFQALRQNKPILIQKFVKNNIYTIFGEKLIIFYYNIKLYVKLIK